MAWRRLIELSVGSAGVGTIVSGLDIDFKIQRSTEFSANTAEFVIYNAKESTRNQILKKNNSVIFKAGYEDENGGNLSALFVGSIIDAISIHDGVNWVTTISAAALTALTQQFNYITVALSFAPGIRLSNVLSTIASTMGLVTYGLENTPTMDLSSGISATPQAITLNNGYVHVGSVMGALNYCKNILKDYNLGLYIDNTELIVYALGKKDSRYSTTYLDATCGLLKAAEIEENESIKDPALKNKKRVSFSSILIPSLQPNSAVTIKSNRVNGTYIVNKLEFTGNNYGGAFNVSGEAVA